MENGIEKTCLCGCGRKFIDTSFKKNRIWFTESCRSKARRHGYRSLKANKEAQIKQQIDAEQLVKEMASAIKGKKLVNIPPQESIFQGQVEEDACLLLSDIHIGKVNYFPNENGKSVQTYNDAIMIEEANRLLETIQQINVLLSPHYNLKKLYIFCLGDLIDNDIILQGQRFFIDAGAGAQLMRGVKLMTDIITELLKAFGEIEVVAIGGNHGRINAKAKDPIPFYNNFDYLLAQILKIAFQNEPRVTITIPESWFHVVTIRGWRYFIHHGNTVWSWMGHPYYGIIRKATARLAEIKFDVECFGHFHERNEYNVASNVKSILNGCWVYKDDYAWRQYGKISVPQQYYFGISDKRPRSWHFDIDLLSSTNIRNHKKGSEICGSF